MKNHEKKETSGRGQRRFSRSIMMEIPSSLSGGEEAVR